MGSISDFAENAMLNHLFNAVAADSPASVWLSFFEGDPTDTGLGGTEPSGNGYARSQITFGAPASRTIQNTAAVTFPQATGNWQVTSLTHYGVHSLQSGGNFLAHGALVNPITVVNGNTPTVAIGEIDILFQDLLTKGGNNNLSDYACNAILNHLFRNTSFLPPATYQGYCQNELADNSTGASPIEPANNYSRLLVNENGGGSPQWRLAASGVVRNQDILLMPTPSGTWGTIVAAFVADAITGGNILFYDNAITDQTINLNDVVRMPIDAFQAFLA